MIFNFGNFTVDVDRERTALFYKKSANTPGELCSCRGCQNFRKAILKAPKEVLEFLDSLGINPADPADVCDAAGDMFDDGTICYAGFYHICGKLIDVPDCFRKGSPVNAETANIRSLASYRIGENNDFSFEFTDDVMLFQEDFPSPCIQLEFYMYLPCVMEELYQKEKAIKRT